MVGDDHSINRGIQKREQDGACVVDLHAGFRRSGASGQQTRWRGVLQAVCRLATLAVNVVSPPSNREGSRSLSPELRHPRRHEDTHCATPARRNPASGRRDRPFPVGP